MHPGDRVVVAGVLEHGAGDGPYREVLRLVGDGKKPVTIAIGVPAP